MPGSAGRYEGLFLYPGRDFRFSNETFPLCLLPPSAGRDSRACGSAASGTPQPVDQAGGGLAPHPHPGA